MPAVHVHGAEGFLTRSLTHSLTIFLSLSPLCFVVVQSLFVCGYSYCEGAVIGVFDWLDTFMQWTA